MAFRYIAPALAVVGTAAAACSGTTTISNSADAAALSTCYTYSGDIAIATSTTDDIALDGVRRIRGSLSAGKNGKLTSISADSLSQIDDSFTLNGVTQLSNLNFPMLTAVDTVDWVALASLNGISFTAGLQTVQNLNIDNTQLQTLDGIDLTEVSQLILANNQYLSDITMPLGNVSTALSIHDNGDTVRVSLPNLVWANNITMANVQSIDLSSLAFLNGSLGFYSNYFSQLSLANLTYVGTSGGGLSFVDNSKLMNVSAPSLKAIGGGLTIANNTDFITVNGFPRLTAVRGAIACAGNFKNVAFPELTDVRGAFELISSNNVDSSCAKFAPLKTGRASVIKGPYRCHGGASKSETGTSSGSGTSSGGSSASSSSNSATAVYISGATGVMGVLAAIFGML